MRFGERPGKEFENIVPTRINLKLSNRRKITRKRRSVERMNDRVRNYQKKKNAKFAEKAAPSNSAYSSNVSLRKAMSRARVGLPRNEEKRATIVNLLNEQYVPASTSTITEHVSKTLSQGLCPKTKESATAFYERIDISSQAPGRKDFVTVRNDDGTKSKIQTKYLLYPISEVYAKFCHEFGPNLLKKSKFFKLRPSHVLPVSETPANLCLCIYHADFINVIDSLNKIVPEIPAYGDEF